MRIRAVLLALFLFSFPAAHALRFSSVQVGKERILYIHDCKDDEPEPCRESELHFQAKGDPEGYEGDEERLRQVLSANRFDRIYLNSRGGDVDAALGMAPLLRDSHLPVHVPKNAFCVSSCTILFMGGYLRTIDPSATYKVHSASRFSEAVYWKTHTVTDPSIEAIAESPEEELRRRAIDVQKNARFTALALFRLFQTTLLIPTGKPSHDEPLEQIHSESKKDLPSIAYTQPGNPEYLEDVNRIQAEGRAAVQDVMMRLERECMAEAIHELEQRTDLGPRSDAALEMIRMMYMESIRETSTLSQSELQRRGYVTEALR